MLKQKFKKRVKHSIIKITVKSITVLIFCFSVLSPCLAQENIPEQAYRHMQRGLTAVKMAASSSDYQSALEEFEKAKELAPNWPDVYYRLALIQEKVGGHINVYKTAEKNVLKYLKFDLDAAKKNMAKELLSRIEKRISFIRDEHTLVGIWLPENSDNSFYAEPRLEISVNNEGKLVGRALAMKAAMMKDVRISSSNAYFDGPFVPISVHKSVFDEPVALELTIEVPPTVYYEWKKNKYWSKDCQEKASFVCTRISENKMSVIVRITGEVVTARGPEPVNETKFWDYKREPIE